MNSELNAAIERSTEAVARELENYLKEKYMPQAQVLNESELYTLMSGGKRIRPFLTLEFCRACGGSIESALPFACAVEMIHTYSLIHDDLPCMDNDDMRRGKPSNHVKFGYANALLAGDGLLTDAFGVIASNKFVSHKQIADAVAVLSNAAGSVGMVGGQVMDLSTDNIDYERLLLIHDKKTSCLIGAATMLGCIAADADGKKKASAVKYAKCIGLTFQIIDDILDARSGEEKEDKTTILSFMSEEEAIQLATQLTQEGKEAIADIPDNYILCEFSDYLLHREK